MDAKEEILQQKDDSIQSLLKETVNLQNELTLMKSQFADFQNSKEKNTNDNTVK
ncbi:unnamed protein product, partial [Rotaria magnacalcarata]